MSGVFLDLHTFADADRAGTTVRLCVDDDCQTTPFNDGAWLARPDLNLDDKPRTVHITALITRADGSVVASIDEPDVPLTRNAPNGEKCGPVCWGAGYGWDSTARRLIRDAQAT
ncbi:MAG: hypothetical protein AB7V43_11425 [Acidimicrobiia bacterium]